MTDAAIRFDHVDFRPGAGFAIEGLSLTVPQGAIYGFLGPNGAGKTTTIRLLLGLERPAAGRIHVLGHPTPREAPQALARIGYVPERPHLHPFLTVSQSIDFHASWHARFDRQWAATLLEQFGLAPDRRLSHLSKGEMGKLLMLQALSQRPDLLVLDEPTDGLDPVVRRDVLAAVVTYVADYGATVFISSHLVHELERLCDWVGVMDTGRLVSELPMAEFKDGAKRLTLRGSVERLGPPPFTVLSAVGHGPTGAVWVIDGWRGDHASWLEAGGVTLEAVDDLDLEEGFVERLRARRNGREAC